MGHPRLIAATELRSLDYAPRAALCAILDHNDAWIKLMELIPSDLVKIKAGNRPKYRAEHIQRIAEHVNGDSRQHRSPTEILLSEWSVSGPVLPNLRHLLIILTQAEMFRAAEYIAVDILGEKRTLPRPARGPAANVDILNV